jgi:hypothetical protein
MRYWLLIIEVHRFHGVSSSFSLERKIMSVLVQQQAPDFKAQAVMPDGSFQQVSMADYKGKYVNGTNFAQACCAATT